LLHNQEEGLTPVSAPSRKTGDPTGADPAKTFLFTKETFSKIIGLEETDNLLPQFFCHHFGSGAPIAAKAAKKSTTVG